MNAAEHCIFGVLSAACAFCRFEAYAASDVLRQAEALATRAIMLTADASEDPSMFQKRKSLFRTDQLKQLL